MMIATIRRLWPFAWAATVRDQNRQLCNAAGFMAMIGQDVALLHDVFFSAKRLVNGPTDAASRAVLIGELAEAVNKVRGQ